jgi:hypothetical protein
MANRDSVTTMKPQNLTSIFLSRILGAVTCVCVALLGLQL